MKFTVKKVIIPPRSRQQLDLLAKFYILKQNQFISWILYLYLYIYIYTHTYMHKHIHTYINSFFQHSWSLDFITWLFRWLFRHMSYNNWKMCQGIFGILFFVKWRRILPLFPSCVTILVYNWDALDTKCVSLGVHQTIRRNSENIEP